MTTFDRRRLMALGAGAALFGATSRAGAADTTAQDGLDSLVLSSGSPALTGGLVTPRGVTGLIAGGLRRKGAPDLVTTNDLWHLGSNTKAMTAALYGRLVDKGRARWGATVPELFPDLALDPAWRTTTVEQLMGHRAGVEEASILSGGWLMKAHRDARPIREQRMEVAGLIFGKPPAGKPGTFAYANFNYVIVGAAIERMLNQDWEQAIIEQLFKPAGIKTAGLGAPKGANPWGHRGRTAAELVAVDPAGLADNPPAMGPAGRAHMSMTDYGRFVRLFLTRGGGVLKPATIQHLTTPVPGEGRAYALGWGVSTDRPWGKGPVLAHEGSNTMWHAAAVIAPARGVAMITAGNAGPQATGSAAGALARQFQERFAPA